MTVLGTLALVILLAAVFYLLGVSTGQAHGYRRTKLVAAVMFPPTEEEDR